VGLFVWGSGGGVISATYFFVELLSCLALYLTSLSDEQ